MKRFHKLYGAGRVKRYHTADVPAQTLGHHSWGVAMIVAMIYPKTSPVPTNLLLAVLTHDLAESETGDTPAPAKWDNNKLGEALQEAEATFNTRYDIEFKLSDEEVHILKWADTFELCLYCSHQTIMGNEYAKAVLQTGLRHLKKIGFPTDEATDLYNDTFTY